MSFGKRAFRSALARRWTNPLRARLRAFASTDNRGVSAVEFALILPVMLMLLFAGAETTTGLQIDRKVTNTARGLSDLASQATSISNTEMSNILNAAADIMAPFPVAKAKIIVTGIQTDILGISRVAWSDAQNTTAYSQGRVMTIPAQLKPLLGTAGFLVLAEVKYTYTPAVAYLISGSIEISDRLYTRPRVGDAVTRAP